MQGLLRWMRAKGLRINLRPLAEIQTLAWLVVALVMLNYFLKLLTYLTLLLCHALFSSRHAGSTAIMPVDERQQELAHIEQQLSSFQIH